MDMKYEAVSMFEEQGGEKDNVQRLYSILTTFFTILNSRVFQSGFRVRAQSVLFRFRCAKSHKS